MKIPKCKRGDIVEVHWRDSHDYRDNKVWYQEEEVEQLNKTDLILQTVGYLYDHDKNFIRLFQSCDTGDLYEQQYSGITSIPVGCIIKIRVLK